MSKSTKIVAGLGVAAALGIAAVPVASFAVTDLSGTVDITATIADSFSMTIDTKTASQAGTAGNAIDFGEVAVNSTDTAGSTTLVVTTNIPDGYNLKAFATGAAGHETALHNAEADADIPGYASLSALTAGTAGWGIKVSAVEKDVADAGAAAARALNGGVFDGTQYLAPTTAGAIIDSIAADSISAMHEVTYTVDYGIATSANQAAGTYAGQVTYTATPVIASVAP